MRSHIYIKLLPYLEVWTVSQTLPAPIQQGPGLAARSIILRLYIHLLKPPQPLMPTTAMTLTPAIQIVTSCSTTFPWCRME